MANTRERGDVKATARYVRIAPDKVRQVTRELPGRSVEEARRLLLVSPKQASEQVEKTLQSAVANAENNEGLDPEDLVVTAATVDEGPTLRRFQPRAMGRATRIRKRTCHLTVAVASRPEEPPRSAGSPAARHAQEED